MLLDKYFLINTSLMIGDVGGIGGNMYVVYVQIRLIAFRPF